MSFDIIIIGGGGAGLMAAIECAKNNLSVALFSKTAPNRSQTVMAQGGINAALSNIENDSIDEHISDTIRGGAGLSDINCVKTMCENAPKIIDFLDNIGVTFNRTGDSKIDQRPFGGASKKRTCFSSDKTGHAIIHTLYDQALSYKNLEIFTDHFALELIKRDNKITGAKFLDIATGEIKTISSKSIIIASGGYSGIFFNNTTNTPFSTGDGIIMTLKAGAVLKNMEFIQFHPTTLKNSSLLISEAARGEGGYLINSDNERFVNELATRDVVAKEIQKQLNIGKEVFLDLRHLDSEIVDKKLHHEAMQCKVFENLDPKKDLIPIKPSAHYSIGGIAVDEKTKVLSKNGFIEGLFACGEVACNGIHGANRLGGNSLLEILVFGQISGKEAVLYAKNTKDVELEEPKDDISKYLNKEPIKDFYHLREFYAKIITKNISIFKDKNSLQNALKEIESLQKEMQFCGITDKSAVFNTNLVDFLEFNNILEIAKIYTLSALKREESRGAHTRDDFLQPDDKYKKNSSIWLEKDELIFGL